MDKTEAVPLNPAKQNAEDDYNYASHEAQRRIDEWVSRDDTTYVLDLSNLNLIKLPSLPSRLKELYCNYNQLTKLPELPQGLEVLGCQCNQLTELPSLPSSLKSLYCYDNQLIKLPPLPPNLIILHCKKNQLTLLPPLPQCLEELYYYGNPLQYPPPEVAERSLDEIKEWMSENPLNFVKSAYKC